MKFRDDIDPDKTWVISDTHFGHDNIVGFCFRPEDHEQAMIAEWRKVVPEKDSTVLHLGDLVYKGNARFKNLTAKELTGERKLLIMGNHDRQRFSFYKQSGFNICRPFAIRYGTWADLSVNGERAQWTPGRGPRGGWQVSFSHYPWSEDEDGPMKDWDLRVHGHIHNNGYRRESFVPFIPQHINISIEQMKYRPVLLRDLLDGYLYGKFHDGDEGIQNG